MFQVPLFIYQTNQALVGLNTNKGNKNVYKPAVVSTAIFVDVLSIIFIVTFVLMMFVRIPTIYSLMNYSVESRCLRMLLSIVIPLLCMVYTVDVMSTLLYYWGAPAYIMTQESYAYVHYHYLNRDGNCWSKLGDFSVYDDDYTLTFTGMFLKVILTVSLFTPLVWTTVFTSGFLGLLVYILYQKKKGGDVHDIWSDQRMDLIHQGREINYSEPKTSKDGSIKANFMDI